MTNDRPLRRRVWQILAVENPADPWTRRVGLGLFLLIALNVLAVILESVQSFDDRFHLLFQVFETISVAIFSVEYGLRLWSAVCDSRYAHPLWGRLRFAFTPMALVDLLAVLPFFLAFATYDLRFIRALRLFRMARIAKLGRYSEAIRLLGRVVLRCREELLITVMLMLFLVVLTSSLMYFAENDAQPDKFPDIPTAMWWSIVTLTTVGYGDVFPITAMGKVFAALVALFGVGMVALPTGILGASFIEELRKQNAPKTSCPHCGGDLG